jgi:hypothetical protein
VRDTRGGTALNYLLSAVDESLQKRLNHPEREDGHAPEHAGAFDAARRNRLLTNR